MWKNLIQIFKRDDLYLQALRESYAMLDLDLEMFKSSVETLRRTDGCEVALDIYKMDKQINAYERDVRRKVLTHLAVSGPGDLSSGLILVSVVVDIERIGDYAKNIFDLARDHPKRLLGGVLEADLVMIENRVTEIFEQMVEAFKTHDADKARLIMTGYKGEVVAACDQIVKKIVTGEVSDLGPSEAASIALYVRYLKRIAAHSRNIMTSVVNPFHRIGYREKKLKNEID
jgi:phosphate transport system protein